MPDLIINKLLKSAKLTALLQTNSIDNCWNCQCKSISMHSYYISIISLSAANFTQLICMTVISKSFRLFELLIPSALANCLNSPCGSLLTSNSKWNILGLKIRAGLEAEIWNWIRLDRWLLTIALPVFVALKPKCASVVRLNFWLNPVLLIVTRAQLQVHE